MHRNKRRAKQVSFRKLRLVKPDGLEDKWAYIQEISKWTLIIHVSKHFQ